MTLHSKTLADEATSVYNSGKMFAFDHIMLEEVVTFAKNTNSSLNIKANPSRQLLKAILLLFIKPSPDGTRKAEKYINPDITKVSVTVAGAQLFLSATKIWKHNGPQKVLHR